MLSQPRMWRYNLVWRKDRVTGHLNANRMPLRQHEDIIVFYDRQPVYHPQMMPCPPERKNHGRRKTDGFTNRCYGEMKLAPVRVAEDKYPTSVISIPKEHKTGAFYHPTQKPVALVSYLTEVRYLISLVKNYEISFNPRTYYNQFNLQHLSHQQQLLHPSAIQNNPARSS